jgi:hypothetical protein
MRKILMSSIALASAAVLAGPGMAAAHRPPTAGPPASPGAQGHGNSGQDESPAGENGQQGEEHGQGKEHGQGQEHSQAAKGRKHPVTYVFRGTYNADGTVHVLGGNAFVRKGGLVGKDVSFDFASSKFSVADTNADGQSNLSDVKTGDKVLVQSRLPRKDPGSQPFAARKLVDQANPPPSEPSEAPGT